MFVDLKNYFVILIGHDKWLNFKKTWTCPAIMLFWLKFFVLSFSFFLSKLSFVFLSDFVQTFFLSGYIFLTFLVLFILNRFFFLCRAEGQHFLLIQIEDLAFAKNNNSFLKMLLNKSTTTTAYLKCF